MIDRHMTHLDGKPVENWYPGKPLHSPATLAYRLRLEAEEAKAGMHWVDKLACLLDTPAVTQISALVVGNWLPEPETGTYEDARLMLEALVVASDRLRGLTTLFLGDMIPAECAITAIPQSDVSALLQAYPGLRWLGLRGGHGLSLGNTLHHEGLNALTIQSGGLAARVVQEITAGHAPALEHLEIWTGAAERGSTVTIDDLAPIFFRCPFPRLRSLAIRNSAISDEIAFAMAHAPLLEQLSVLDLSLGTLSDIGAAALIESPAIHQLQKLIINHHFCSPGVVAELQQLGIVVEADDAQEEDIHNNRVDGRFIATLQQYVPV